MKAKVQNLKGFRDFGVVDSIKRQWLIEKIKEVFELWGYDPIETPTIEPLELFEGNIGEDEKLFYKFTDHGGRNVALKYDQTVPAARYVSSNWQDLPTPFKRYQIQEVFRAENPQKGRYRQFLQCDADIYGSASPLADAEMIALSLDIFNKLNIPNVKALISSRNILGGIPQDILPTIDKIKKIGREQVKKEISENNLYTLKEADEFVEKLENSKPDKNLNEIFKILEAYGIDREKVVFDPFIVRSFSYSTGAIWEVVDRENESLSLLGGERYDKLVKTLSGVDIPATGFGLGFDRVLEMAQELGILPQAKTRTKVLVTVFSKNTLDASIKTLKLLQNAGVNSEIFPDLETKLDKQIKYADKKGVSYVAIIGPDEIVKNEVSLKDLKNKTQESVPTIALLSKIK
jgi:histidyl-tRNA synthetase